MSSRPSGTKNILLVEDNIDDRILFKLYLKQSGVQVNLFTVEDGEKAVNFVNKKKEFENMPPIDLIFLDINLPRLTGFEVLSILKKDQKLRHIPVIIFSGSSYSEDIAKAYNLYATCYINKEKLIDTKENFFNDFDRFWLKKVSFV